MPVYDCGDPECDECRKAFGPDRTKAIESHRKREAYYAELERERTSALTTARNAALEEVETVLKDHINSGLRIGELADAIVALKDRT